MPDSQYKAAEAKLLAALAQREYGHQELLNKYANQFAPGIVAAVLDTLVERGWQSDERYAQSFVQSAVSRGKGELLIRQYLRQQQIHDHFIDAALAEHDFQTLAQLVYRKKYHGKPITDRKELAKRQRFLASRGFSFEQIHEVLNHHDD